MFYLEKLHDLIIASTLPEAEAVEFINAISELSESDFVDILEIFQNEPDLIPIIYKNYKNKVSALSNQDLGRLDEIIEKEIKLIAQKDTKSP